MNEDKQIELIMDSQTGEKSECCDAPIGAGRCWNCKEVIFEG